MARAQLSTMLGKSLGDAKAAATIDAACDALGLGRIDPLTLTQAMDVLESIASQGGIVGVTARFAKSRVHLMG